MTEVPTPAHYTRAGSEPRKEGMRALNECPVARSEAGEWIVIGHEQVTDVALNDAAFSSATSRFIQIPNGLDGTEHSAYRAIIDRYFTADRMKAFEPVLREAVRSMMQDLAARVADAGGSLTVDAVNDVGAHAAVNGQSVWLGWRTEVGPLLLEWMQSNHAATRSGDLENTSAVAEQFDAIIQSVLDRRRANPEQYDDVTSELMREEVALPDGSTRLLNDAELVSILRNWTGGDLGSIALCIGVLTHGFVKAPHIAERFLATASFTEKAAIVDEFLRLDNPFISNRRVVTTPTDVAGFTFNTGDRLRLNWTAANIDPRAFEDPHSFDAEGNRDKNLVYGTGKHVCPGRPLATLELVTVMEEFLKAFDVTLTGSPEREITPLGGYAHLPIILKSRI